MENLPRKSISGVVKFVLSMAALRDEVTEKKKRPQEWSALEEAAADAVEDYDKIRDIYPGGPNDNGSELREGND